MAIVRYDPWTLMGDLQNELNRVFDTRLRSAPATDNSAVVTSDWVPPVDVVEDQNRYVIYADVPGVDPNKIEVHMENGVLIMRGERAPAEVSEKATVKRAERTAGTFYRRFSLPDTADADRISANCRNGVLQVVIPKHEKVQPRRISVEG